MTTTIPAVPTLDVDSAAISRGWRPTAEHIVERQIVWALIHTMTEAHPGRSIVVYDGEENVSCGDPQAAMEVIFNLDEAGLRLGRAWVFLVLGNGVDVISDYGMTPATDAAVGAAMKATGLS